MSLMYLTLVLFRTVAKLAVVHMLLRVEKLEERSSNVVILSGIVNPRSHGLCCCEIRNGALHKSLPWI
jgi:hypothetical protein